MAHVEIADSLLTAVPAISVVINNYNYARFLGRAIESVLSQTRPADQIIVVDDGSTDNSLEVVVGFGKEVILVAKENGGQASAFNKGFAEAVGDWILFLDADDFLHDHALESLELYLSEEVGRIEFYLTLVDEDERPIGYRKLNLLDGDAYERIEKEGRMTINPTSGNLFSRRVLEKALPLPEREFKLCADAILIARTSEFGPVKAVRKCLAAYRLHGKNLFSSKKNGCCLSISRRIFQNSYYLRRELKKSMARNGRLLPIDYAIRSMAVIEAIRRTAVLDRNPCAIRFSRQLPTLLFKGAAVDRGLIRRLRGIFLACYAWIINHVSSSAGERIASFRIRLHLN